MNQPEGTGWAGTWVNPDRKRGRGSAGTWAHLEWPEGKELDSDLGAPGPARGQGAGVGLGRAWSGQRGRGWTGAWVLPNQEVKG